MSADCRHEESLYGRCTACGMTWEQQEQQRGRAVDWHAYALGFVEDGLRHALEAGERPTLAEVRRMLETIEATERGADTRE